MLKDALIVGDDVKDSEGYWFKVVIATPSEVVLELSPADQKNNPTYDKYYVAVRNDRGCWVDRDDQTIQLVELD